MMKKKWVCRKQKLKDRQANQKSLKRSTEARRKTDYTLQWHTKDRHTHRRKLPFSTAKCI